jgi:alpha-beta hydrolase superfamily lysophospholipase
MPAQPPAQTIVLIHGMWMTPRSWEHWIARYETRGHRVIAPAWPGLEGEVEELRRDPAPLTRLGLARVIDHYDTIVRALESPPIIMGHSFGGTVVQVLLDRGLGSAGVGIASGPVKGIFHVPFSALRVVAPVLRNPFNRNKATGLTPKQFHYAFANTMTREESDQAYERYHVPAANRLLFQGLCATFKRNGPVEVNFRHDARAPLLFIAGGDDHATPASLIRRNARKYRNSRAITAYQEFPGRCHLTVGQSGWEQVADHALDWATNPPAELGPKGGSVSNLIVTGHQHTA